MSDNLKDILSNSNKDIDNQQLMDYLSNQLSKAQSHEMEANMADDPFLNDAVEGLQEINNKDNIGNYTLMLNQELQKVIGKHKKARDRRRWKDSPTIYIVIITVLLFMVLCYFLLKKKVFNSPRATLTKKEIVSTSPVKDKAVQTIP
jgi:hypothetical protein